MVYSFGVVNLGRKEMKEKGNEEKCIMAWRSIFLYLPQTERLKAQDSALVLNFIPIHPLGRC